MWGQQPSAVRRTKLNQVAQNQKSDRLRKPQGPQSYFILFGISCEVREKGNMLRLLRFLSERHRFMLVPLVLVLCSCWHRIPPEFEYSPGRISEELLPSGRTPSAGSLPVRAEQQWNMCWWSE